MAIARSKLTAQGRISIPAPVRKKLGIGPGSASAGVSNKLSVRERDEVDGRIIQRAALFSFKDIHHALFGDKPPKPHSLKELKNGISRDIRRRHARR